jgi:antitoxin component of MazEF toxin-antitoxin module
MKTPDVINRWSRKATRHGNSLFVSLPVDLTKEWSVSEGDNLIVYQLDRALVVIPLSRLLEEGEPELLKPLAKALQ